MVRYRAILFDADRTLWYSPTSPDGVWRRILTDLGLDVPSEQVEAAWEKEWRLLAREFAVFESSRHPNEQLAVESMWPASEKRIIEGLGLTVDLDRLRRVADDRFAANADLYPETLDVLTRLSTMGMRFAIVSNGVNQEQTAGRLGIDGYFHAIVGSVHVGFAKPSPEIFHLALSALGIGSEQAIMVGDNWEADVLGAKGAGIRGVHLARDGDSPGSDSMKDLRGLIDILTPNT